MPEFYAFLAPTLRVLSDGEVRQWRIEVEPLVVAELGLTDADYADVLPSGLSRIRDRVGWAATYLVQAGMLTRPERGFLQITAEGQKLLEKHPNWVDRKILSQFTRFDEFSNRRKKRPVPDDRKSLASEGTPQEQIEKAYEELRKNFELEILNEIHLQKPIFLEKLSVKLLEKMGYVGTRGEGRHTGSSGDGGVDGEILMDELGVDRIYLQAKRYKPESKIDVGEIRGFFGALKLKRVDRGVLITTAQFTEMANDVADEVHIALIDGHRLVDLMIKYQVGIRVKRVLPVCEIDDNLFYPQDPDDPNRFNLL